MSRTSIQKIYGNVYFNPTDEGHGCEGKIREATLFGREISLVSSDGVTKRLNRGSLIEFLNAETEKIEGLKDKRLEKGWFFGCFFGSSDNDIRKVYRSLFEKMPDKNLNSAGDAVKKNKSAILHILENVTKDKRIKVVKSIDPDLKADLNFMFEIIKIAPEALPYIPEKYIGEGLLKIAKEVPDELRYIPQEYINKGLLKIAKEAPDELQYIPQEYINKGLLKIAKEDPDELQYIPQEYINKGLLKIAKEAPDELRYIPEKYINKDLFFEIAKEAPEGIQYISVEINKDDIFQILSRSPEALQYVPEKYMDEGCILEIAERFPNVVDHISDRLFDNLDFIEISIKFPKIIPFVLKKLFTQNEIDKFLFKIISGSPQIIKSIPDSLISDTLIIKIAEKSPKIIEDNISKEKLLKRPLGVICCFPDLYYESGLSELMGRLLREPNLDYKQGYAIRVLDKYPEAFLKIPENCITEEFILMIAGSFSNGFLRLSEALAHLPEKYITKELFLNVINISEPAAYKMTVRPPQIFQYLSQYLSEGEIEDRLLKIVKAVPEALLHLPEKYINEQFILEVAKEIPEALAHLPKDYEINEDTILKFIKEFEPAAINLAAWRPKVFDSIKKVVDPTFILKVLKKNPKVKDQLPEDLDYLLKILKLDEEKILHKRYKHEMSILRECAHAIIEKNPVKYPPEDTDPPIPAELMEIIFSLSGTSSKILSKSLEKSIIKNKIFLINEQKSHVSNIFGEDISVNQIIKDITQSEFRTAFKYADFSGLGIADYQLEMLLAECPNIEYLNLSGCFRLKGNLKRHIGDLKNLMTLDISGGRRINSDIFKIANYPALKYVNLPEYISEDMLKMLIAKCPNIEHLNISDSHLYLLSDDSLMGLKELKKLVTLSISRWLQDRVDTLFRNSPNVKFEIVYK